MIHDMRLPLATSLVALVLAPAALAETLKVPSDDFPTIQSAVDASVEGDVVQVGKGVYLEDVFVAETHPGITLQGKGATIDAEYDDPCITVEARDVTITGFTLVNGTDGIHVRHPPLDPDGGGFNPANGAIITKNRISSSEDTGIVVETSNAVITQNGISFAGSDGILVAEEDPASVTEISRNSVLQVSSDGIVVDGQGGYLIERNKIALTEEDGIDVDLRVPNLDGIGALPVTISKNTVNDAGARGIDVDSEFNAPVLVDGNKVTVTEDDCIELSGINFTVTGNRADSSLRSGFMLCLEGATIEKNTAQKCIDYGFIVGNNDLEDGDGGLSGNNDVANNTAKNNGRDGMIVVGGDNTLAKNKCTGNGGDGIDFDQEGATGNTAESNTCTKNAHQGISNDGTGTDLIKNKCKQNGTGLGPDIAGTGDGGVGSVDVFDSNSFGTGGAKSPSRVDRESIN